MQQCHVFRRLEIINYDLNLVGVIFTLGIEKKRRVLSIIMKKMQTLNAVFSKQ